MAGKTMYRVWRHTARDGTTRRVPWWFGSRPSDPGLGNRFDLPAPMGTCYMATSQVGAVLEALQAFLVSLPSAELAARRIARIQAPPGAPRAARLTAQRLAGQYGLTAALWAGPDRTLTQRWADAFRRDGWWALYGGLQHDPSGRLRGWALFDHAGEHPPTIGDEWQFEAATIVDDVHLKERLASFGVVVRDPGELDFQDL